QGQILAKLQDAEKARKLPTWEDVVNLRATVENIVICYTAVIRGKLLLDVERRLVEHGLKPEFFNNNAGKPEKQMVSPYDSRFVTDMAVRIRVGDIAFVC